VDVPNPAAKLAQLEQLNGAEAKAAAQRFSKNGETLVAGDETGSNTEESPTNAAELYDPSTSTFTATGSMNLARADARLTPLPNAEVLIAGVQPG
jgi:hypothetical protein